MKKALVLLTVVLLVFLVFIGQIASNVRLIRATPAPLRVPDDYPTIQAAINAAVLGETISVAPGVYVENVVVNKTVKLVGDDKEFTIIDGNGKGPVIRITATNVGVSGFTIQNASKVGMPSVGVFLATTTGSNITGNIIQTSWMGIYLDSSSGNTIRDNMIRNNSMYGIYISQSGNNNFDHNTVMDNRYGFVISLYGSGGNVLRNNNMSRNSQNFKLFTASDLSHFVQDIDSSNTVDGKPIYYWMNQRDRQVPSDAGYVAIINSTGITVKDAVLTRNGEGVLFVYTINSTVDNVNASNNIGGDGIVLRHSSNNYIFRSTTSNNLGWGIWLDASDDNIILGNKVTNNSGGIGLDECTNNIIYGNTITNGTAYGIYARNSENNTVYYNSFEANAIQVYSEASLNSWDDGYPSGGNYWSDYNGTDLYSGPYQNQTGSDGIGDTPYIIDANNTDRYPLMNPPPPLPAFVISASPYSQNVKPGQSVTYTVTVVSVNSFSSDVHLNGTLNPSSNDISFAFNPETVTPPPNGSVQSVLTVSAVSTAAPETYVVAVNATNAGHPATDTVEIIVLDIIKPIADAGQDQTVSQGTSVTLDGSNSTDNVGIVSYEWNFGDGISGTGVRVTHIYANVGTYNVTLTVKDAAENSGTDSVTITVTAALSDSFLLLILAATGGIVTVGIVLSALFLRRRKRQVSLDS